MREARPYILAEPCRHDGALLLVLDVGIAGLRQFDHGCPTIVRFAPAGPREKFEADPKNPAGIKTMGRRGYFFAG